MTSLLSEFRDFLFKSNMLALAVAVVIGNAVNKVVGGIVDNVLMPLIGVALPGEGSWRSFEVGLPGGNALKLGDLMGRVVEFVIVAFVVFVITKALIAKPKAPDTKTCPFCKESIAKDATKCRACTSALPAV